MNEIKKSYRKLKYRKEISMKKSRKPEHLHGNCTISMLNNMNQLAEC